MARITRSTLKLPTQRWRFISDSELRRMLVRDYEELSLLLKVGAHKSAVVLFGSIMEATLVDVLKHTPEADRKEAYRVAVKDIKEPQREINVKPPEDWKLHEMIKALAHLGRLGSDAGAKADIVRGYRNLIHPMAETRDEYTLNEHTVTSIGLLFLEVIRNLEGRVKASVKINEEAFLTRLTRTRGPEEAETARQIFTWAKQHNFVDEWTKAGAYMPRLSHKGVGYAPIALTANSKIYIRFGNFLKKPGPLRFRAERLHLSERLNSIPGVTITAGGEGKFPPVPLARFTNDSQRIMLIEFLDTLVSKVREA